MNINEEIVDFQDFSVDDYSMIDTFPSKKVGMGRGRGRGSQIADMHLGQIL